jgi:hypothetical protein
MNQSPLLSTADIERLLSQQTLSNRQPWLAGDAQLIEEHLRVICAAVTHATETQSKVEWEDYGSGYASFVDAWFYKAQPAFHVKNAIPHGEKYTGLVVLLSRLAPYFAFIEGGKHWHAQGASSYLPEFAMLDRLETQEVVLLAKQVQPVLESYGLTRVLKEQLAEPLASHFRVPTILADEEFTQFDALFYWAD